MIHRLGKENKVCFINVLDSRKTYLIFFIFYFEKFLEHKKHIFK